MTAPARAFADFVAVRPWIGPQTPVAASNGIVAAGRLQPGDLVRTEAGLARVALAVRACVPAQGSGAPVLLRAPYFAARCDLLVSPDQPVVLCGSSVEYLFGEDEVLAEARLLVDGRTALFATHREVADVVFLTLERGGAVAADGCGLAIEGWGAERRPLLSAPEVAALMSQRGAADLGRVA